jgi:hypothetical protein
MFKAFVRPINELIVALGATLAALGKGVGIEGIKGVLIRLLREPEIELGILLILFVIPLTAALGVI